MSNKVQCEETKVSKTPFQNDRDYLNDVLATSKSITTNTALAIIEASNVTLRNEFKRLFETFETLQRENYVLAWNKGWYTLEESEKTKIKEATKNLSTKLEELNEKNN